MLLYWCSRVVATSGRYHQAGASYVGGGVEWSRAEWRVCLLRLFVLVIIGYWRTYVVRVFAGVRSDVLGKWRSGSRQERR